MLALRRIGAYLAAFLGLLLLLAWTDLHRPLDYSVFRGLAERSSEDLELADDVVLIDVPYRAPGADSFDLPSFRGRVADLMGVIAARARDGHRPKAVVLDMYIASDDRELETLVEAARELVEQRIPVYAVFDTQEADEKYFEEIEAELAGEFYDVLGCGWLHTAIVPVDGVLTYASDIPIEREDGSSHLVESLALRVARDLNSKVVRPHEPTRYALPVGDADQVHRVTYAFTHEASRTDGGRFTSSGTADALSDPDEILRDNVVVVGSLEEDRFDRLGIEQSGPALVVWGIDHQRGANQLAPLNHFALVLGQILTFALLVALVFALLFKYVKRLQTKPLPLAGLSFVICGVAFAAYFAALLALNRVPQVGLTLFAMLLAALLCWRFAYKFLVTGVADGAERYDVFISYSRQHGDWVVENLYEPLRALRTADGRELSIFFDRDSIGVGEAFTSKYMWAIVDSRIFIPVFSEGYYAKGHCRNEMDLAHKRFVEKKLTILPICCAEGAVPEIYTHLNYVDAQTNPRFFEDIRSALDPGGTDAEPASGS